MKFLVTSQHSDPYTHTNADDYDDTEDIRRV